MVIDSGQRVNANRELPVAKNIGNNFVNSENTGHNATFAKYLTRLIALVQKRMSARLATRFDPEDVVMSAYRSFFSGMRDGRLTAETSQDVWRLLVEMSLHKLYRQAAYHFAKKRAVDREIGGEVAVDVARTREPTPESAAILADELAFLWTKLDDSERKILELRLQGFELTEIAAEVHLSERTVRRALDVVKAVLKQRFSESWPRETVSRGNRQKNVSQSKRAAAITSADVTSLDFRDYLLLEQIGTGSFAKVYRATKLSDGTMVAVKFLRKAWVRNKDAVRRFTTEAKILTSLVHPHIAGIEGWGRTPNQSYFLVLQFASGGDLQQRFREVRPNWREAVQILKQIAAAAAFAQDHGVIHGDIKPGNVLLTADDQVLLTDFGLAVPFSVKRQPRQMCGTPAFLAPELLEQSPAVATDVFGLGATLFFLLTGQSPYRGATTAEMLEDILSARELTLPAELQASLPRQLSVFCDRCLRREPTERFATVALLMQELAAISTA